jgi:HD-GYP domain-containing protein (c-di-GMP phosphodiesterase class II)
MTRKIHYWAEDNLSAILHILPSNIELVPCSTATLVFPDTTGILLATVEKFTEQSFLLAFSANLYVIVLGDDVTLAQMPSEWLARIQTFLSINAPAAFVHQQIERAFQFLTNEVRTRQVQVKLAEEAELMTELNRVGVALSSERNVEKLLDMILTKARALTKSDAASLYLVEKAEGSQEVLRFRYTQNDSIGTEELHNVLGDYTLPISDRSIAGFVAETGIPLVIDDVRHMPIEAPYFFNDSFDKRTGYCTRSMLVVPLLNAYHYVIGVLQLINHKLDNRAKITSLITATQYVQPYPQDLVDVAMSLASQAAVALENSLLYQNIKNLFEGFVSAAVTAIEQRDPTTSGHSFRVAELTVGLAEIVDRYEGKPFSGIHFTKDQLTEIRYASLLHDFGKVGVREEVLVKAKKLYPLELENLRWRFEYYRRLLQEKHTTRKLNYLLEKGKDAYISKLVDWEQQLLGDLGHVDEMWHMVLMSNEPTILAEGSFERLAAIAEKTLYLVDGTVVPLMSDKERRTLSIPRGSLSEEERREIESHAYHTYVFLSQIPWTQEWKDIPRIAGSHHEKLDGSGYPHSVKAREIPIQSRMMTIADIFDALTASDRPYKRSVPVERALGIIETEVKQGQIDAELFRLFLESRVYDRVLVTS